MGHQYNTSAGNLPNVAQQMNNYNHDQLHNGNGDSTVHEGSEELDNENWKEQRETYDVILRDFSGPHARARHAAQQAKSFNIVPLGGAAEELQIENRGRSRYAQTDQKDVTWVELDLGGQGLCKCSFLSPMCLRRFSAVEPCILFSFSGQ